MVEQWSPKPRAEGSNPSAPAKKRRRIKRRLFFTRAETKAPKAGGTCRAADPAAANGGRRAGMLAQWSKSAAMEERRPTLETARGWAKLRFQSFCFRPGRRTGPFFEGGPMPGKGVSLPPLPADKVRTSAGSQDTTGCGGVPFWTITEFCPYESVLC